MIFRLGRRGIAAVGLGIFSMIAVPVCRADPAPAGPTTAEVDAAIKKGVAYLWKQQQPGGQWEATEKREGTGHLWAQQQGGAFGGYSALVTYALLAAGENRNDPHMAAAISFLKHADIVGPYSLGLRCQVWANLPQSADVKKLFQQDADSLLSGIIREGPAAGLWDYSSAEMKRRPPMGPIDRSVSQYAILGLWAAAQNDANIPVDLWRHSDRVWRSQQNKDGSWSYSGAADAAEGTLSMTAAGVATLLIIQDMTSERAPMQQPCTGNYVDKQIDAGMRWIAQRMDKIEGLYTFYGLERIGAASGREFFGQTDWYGLGVEKIIAAQKSDGSWSMGGIGTGALNDTAFALIFLSHGRSPVIVNKLNYQERDDPGAPQAPWNQRPRDVANLVRFIGRTSEAYLNWQAVNIGAPVEKFHNAPILYISGNRALEFTPAQEAKLKRYAEDGGLIVAHADCPGAPEKDPFTASVVDLGARLFKRRFRELPPTHALLSNEQYKSNRWPKTMSLRGITNGSRELMLLIPAGDPGRAWQSNAFRTDPAKFEMGADIVQYAVDKQFRRYKGETHLVRPLDSAATQPATAPTGPTPFETTRPAATTRPAPAARAMTLRVGRLQVGDNWDPEPGGWRRIDAILRNQFHLALDIAPIPLGTGRLREFKVVHLTGTAKFVLTPAQRKEIATFVAGGGTLVVDATGGSPDFADAAENELAAIFGGAPGEVGAIIPADDPIYRRPGAVIDDFDYRLFLRQRTTGKLDAPRLRGIAQGGRYRVLFSREDLSTGMVGEAVDGILGYAPATATAIMRNVLLAAANGQ